MNHEGLDQWMKMGKSFPNPWGEWSKVTTEICRKLTQQNMDIIGDNFSRMSDQLKRLSHAKKPEDILSLQKECINEDVTAAIEDTQKIIQNMIENIDEFSKLCGDMRDTALTKAHVKERSGK